MSKKYLLLALLISIFIGKKAKKKMPFASLVKQAFPDGYLHRRRLSRRVAHL
jgi:hypothetical protein